MQPLMEAGLDSIAAVELRNTVSAKFGVDLPATATFDYPTADALARFIAGRAAEGSADAWPQPVMVSVPVPSTAAAVQHIADELIEATSGEQGRGSLE
jgi:hypothetical protein